MEGEQAELPQVGDLAQRDVPRCELQELIGDVWTRVKAAGWDVCAVVNQEDVVLGLLREQELQSDGKSTAEQVMRSGPATYRPDALVSDVAKQLSKRNVAGVLVTRSDGTLIGWLRRDDAELAAEG